MPRVKVSVTEEMNKEVRAALKAGEQRKGMKWDAAAKYLGVSASTYFKRLKNPEKFTLGELRIIVKFAESTDEEILKMVRG